MPHRTAFLLRLPESIREDATALAKADGISLNHFVSLALAEKLQRLSLERLERRKLTSTPRPVELRRFA